MPDAVVDRCRVAGPGGDRLAIPGVAAGERRALDVLLPVAGVRRGVVAARPQLDAAELLAGGAAADTVADVVVEVVLERRAAAGDVGVDVVGAGRAVRVVQEPVLGVRVVVDVVLGAARADVAVVGADRVGVLGAGVGHRAGHVHHQLPVPGDRGDRPQASRAIATARHSAVWLMLKGSSGRSRSENAASWRRGRGRPRSRWDPLGCPGASMLVFIRPAKCVRARPSSPTPAMRRTRVLADRRRDAGRRRDAALVTGVRSGNIGRLYSRA